MINWSNISALTKNEIQLEFKNKHTIGAVLLFVFSSTFLAYLAFKQIESPLIWNGIFWLMILFASINGTANSFKENQGQGLYLYSLISSRELIFSKIIFNAALLTIVAFLCLFFYSLFLGYPIQHHFLFILSCIVGSFCISSILTLSSGIAHKAAGNSSLFNVLSIPILIPVIILLITLSIDTLKDKTVSTFIEAEMYANEEKSIKAELIFKHENNWDFLDSDGNSRRINYSKIENSNLANDYLLKGKFSSQTNKYDITEILPYQNKSLNGAWFKLLTIVLINIIMIFIAYLVFPKFWTE